MIRVCAVDDVPAGEGRAIEVDGRNLAVFHAASGWYVTDGVCPHRGGPLADGIVADASVICPLHERRFSLRDGREAGGSLCVATFPVSVHGDSVYAQIDRLALAA
ncbi:nitrite reductase small subunit NirD [Conexibacter sp. DBS9H8]|uniref:nitrite reductase small subunit NirD n=1 Tax=Conexibacter sp. DBS9H8 TaxID=2937801 RepID=UPI00200D349C|nr:nitrite reductase small subunit NirD [Conexibacter sp. DBS9H8]